MACSFILYALGRYGDAAALAREVTAVVPDSPLGNATLVAALVRDGKRDEARRLLAVHLQRDPSFSFPRIALEGPGERFMAARGGPFRRAAGCRAAVTPGGTVVKPAASC